MNMHPTILLIILAAEISFISAFEIESDSKRHLRSVNNCVDNPNGIITEISGESVDNNKEEFNYVGKFSHQFWAISILFIFNSI